MHRLTHWAVSIAAALVALPADAVQITYVANLDGASENPPNASLGTGTARVTIDDQALTMRVEAAFQNLTGNTTASHIHCCTDAPGNAGVATTVPTFPASRWASPRQLRPDVRPHVRGELQPHLVNNNGGTVDSARAALLAGLAAGRAYLNIHSSFRPGGEIRGFMRAVPVPEPGALVLLALGLLAVAVTLRRRRRG